MKRESFSPTPLLPPPADRGRSRPIPAMEIYILTDQQPYGDRLRARAHLRNKAGYLYLCWREGRRIRSYYLGKAAKSSPTTSAPTARSGTPPRRAKRSA